MKRICLLIFILLSFNSFSQNDLKIISWNIRDFGSSKEAETLNDIADIVKDYEIVILQEVVAGYGGSQAIAKLADVLNRKGSKWLYAVSQATISPPYKTEKYAFLWKPSRVEVIGKTRLVSELENQIDREPFLVSFRKNDIDFQILNYHSRIYKDKPEEEISYLVDFVIKQTKTTILVGDFNTKESDEVFNLLYENDYGVALKNEKTTLKRECKENKYTSHAIDNIFFPKKVFIKIFSEAKDIVLNCRNLERVREMSDHLPVVLELNFCN